MTNLKPKHELQSLAYVISKAATKSELLRAATEYERIYFANFRDIPDNGNWFELLKMKISHARSSKATLVERSSLLGIRDDIVESVDILNRSIEGIG